MRRLCLSAALLFLLVILVDGTPVYEHHSLDQDSQPAFCLEPKLAGSCKNKTARYFYNAKAGCCEPFIYSGCEGNKNNFNTIEDCLKSCCPDCMKTCCPLEEVQGLDRGQGTGGGEGLGKEVGLRGPHTIHPAQCPPPRCCQEKRLQCPAKPTLSEFSRERMAEGQPLMPLCGPLSLITCSPFSVGNSDSATLQGRSVVLLSAPHGLGKLTSFL
ncbi:hypothetical protein G4228_015278 [Cervus hanglu yarkandensis]|nr:hypothetical protein G4228_015278 [Cervus hanglu yarkandensis]